MDHLDAPYGRSVPVPESTKALIAYLDTAVRTHLKFWVASVGLDPLDYGTHSIRRTKATLI